MLRWTGTPSSFECFDAVNFAIIYYLSTDDSTEFARIRSTKRVCLLSMRIRDFSTVKIGGALASRALPWGGGRV